MIVRADLRTDEEIARDSAAVREAVAGWQRRQRDRAARLRGEAPQGEAGEPPPPRNFGEAYLRRRAALDRARAGLGHR